MNTFNPAKFSLAENEFLLTALDSPPIVALRSLPTNVNKRAVEPLLMRVQELEQQKLHEKLTWCGVEAIKASIGVYLERASRWRADHSRGAPRFPSFFTFTKKGAPVWSAPGTDSGSVTTYFSKEGQRKSLVLDLVSKDQPEWNPEWITADDTTTTAEGQLALTRNRELDRIECPCGHTEKYRDEVRSSYTAARARMSKHLRRATELVEMHRGVYANEFSS